MTKIAIGDALAAGFRLIGRKPLVPLAWGVVYLLLFSLPVTAVSFTAMPKVATMALNPVAGGTAFLEIFVVEAVFGILTFSLMNAAIFRAVLRPEQDGRFYLRLGGDEGRQALVLIALGAVMLLVGFVATLVLIVLGTILGLATGLNPAGASQAAVIAIVYAVLVVVVAVVAVRFSLSGPLTFAKRRFSFSQSWTLTRGNVWRLIGIGAVLTVIGLVYLVVFAGLGYAVGRSGQALTSAGVADALSSPSRVLVTAVLMLLGAAASGYLLPIVTAPWAEAYRQLSGHGMAEVFSDHPGPWQA